MTIHWQLVIEKEGQVIYEKEAHVVDPVPPDPFAGLAIGAQEADESARVSVTVQRTLPYGEVKCSFTLSISCAQKKSHMDYAARELFALAVQYTNDGMSWVAPGTPPLQVPIMPPQGTTCP